MARRAKQTSRAMRPARLSGAVEALTQPTPIPAALLAPIDMAWIDEEEPEGEVLGMPGAETAQEEPASRTAPALTVRPILDPDLDQLWDWIRTDEDRGLAFLGFAPTTTRALYTHFASISQRVALEQAAAYAIDGTDGLVGFAVLDPIRNGEAMLALYLAPEFRGRLSEAVPDLLALCAATHPDLALAVITTDPVRARLYQRFGFSLTYLLRKGQS